MYWVVGADANITAAHTVHLLFLKYTSLLSGYKYLNWAQHIILPTTTGNRHFAECRKLCRVYFIGHSAKTALSSVFFRHSAKMTLPSVFFRHPAKMYFAKCHFSALGKMRLCRVPFFGTRQRGGTRQNVSLPSAFFCNRQRDILPCAFFGPRQIIFSKQFLRP